MTEDKESVLIHLRSHLSMLLVWMLITFQISQQWAVFVCVSQLDLSQALEILSRAISICIHKSPQISQTQQPKSTLIGSQIHQLCNQVRNSVAAHIVEVSWKCQSRGGQINWNRKMNYKCEYNELGNIWDESLCLIPEYMINVMQLIIAILRFWEDAKPKLAEEWIVYLKTFKPVLSSWLQAET